MMGHLLHVLGGKKKIHTAFRGVVGAWDALGLVHASTAFFFFFLVADLCYPVWRLLIRCAVHGGPCDTATTPSKSDNSPA